MAEQPSGMDLATLGLRIDASEFRAEEQSTEQRLRKLDEAGRAVEERFEKISEATQEAARSQDTYGTAAETEAERRLRIERSTQARFEADQRERASRRAREAEIRRRQAIANATAEAKARADALERQYRLDIARIREGQARQFLSPEEAAEAGREAGRRFNQGIVGELDRAAQVVPRTSGEGQAILTDLGSRIKNVDEAAQQASTGGLGRLNNTLASAARQAAGAHPAIGQVANTLSSLAVGTAATTGILAGITAIGLAIRELTKDFRENRRAVSEAREELEELAERRRTEALGPGGGLLEPTANVRAEIERLEQRFQRLAGEGSQRGIAAEQQRLQTLQSTFAEILELQELLAEGEAEISEQREEAAEEERRQREREAEERARAAEEERRAQEELFRLLTDRTEIIGGMPRIIREQAEAWREARRELQRYREALGLPGQASPITGGPRSGTVDFNPTGASADPSQFSSGEISDESLAKFDAASRSVVGLADSAGLLDGSARDAARGLSDIIGGLATFDAAQGKFGEIVGAVGIASGVVGSIGGFIDALMSRDERRRQEELRLARERNALLQSNEATLRGLFDREGVTAAQFSATGAAFEALPRTTRSDLPLLIGGLTGEVDLNPAFAAQERDQLVAFLDQFGISVEDFIRATGELNIDLFTESGKLIPEAIDQIIAATEKYQEEVQRQQDLFREEIEVRRLLATGQEEEGQALRRRLQEEEEVRRAREAGFDEETIAALEAVQAEERLAEVRRESIRVVEQLERAQEDLALGPLSTLSPTDQLMEARSQFDAMRELALGGDVTAAESLPGAAQELLQASREVNASGAGFAATFDFVNATLDAVQAQFEERVSAEEQALREALEEQRRTTQGVEGVDQTVTDVGVGIERREEQVFEEQRRTREGVERVAETVTDVGMGIERVREGIFGLSADTATQQRAMIDRLERIEDAIRLEGAATTGGASGSGAAV